MTTRLLLETDDLVLLETGAGDYLFLESSTSAYLLVWYNVGTSTTFAYQTGNVSHLYRAGGVAPVGAIGTTTHPYRTGSIATIAAVGAVTNPYQANPEGFT